MLTPVDVQNKVFKGGIGFDKKDVETFMKDLSSDYEQLYRSNVELKDKVATLTESLQHYRSTEDSMQKALTLSEKTAEETIIAANDKARQINNEATKKAETILADAKQELIETKDEIHRLKQLHAKFKAQYTKILQGQLQLIENKVVDIDLGEGYEMGDFSDSGRGFGEGGFGGGGLGGGLGSLGEGGGYTGASSFDDRFERTNQEPAFNHTSLNTDPFSDAANGGGRFSKQTGKGFTGSSSSSKKNTASGESKSSLNMKNASAGSPKVKRNFSGAAANGTESAADKAVQSSAAPHNTQTTASDSVQHKAAGSANHVQAAAGSVNHVQATAAGSVNHVQATAASSVSHGQAAASTVAAQSTAAAPKAEAPKTAQSTDFQTAAAQAAASATFTSATSPFTTASVNTPQFHEDTLKQEEAISGEVEETIDESTLIGNDDDDSEGFNFMDEDSSEPETSFDDGVVSGEVEEKLDESTLIGNDDDDDEGFNFMDDAGFGASEDTTSSYGAPDTFSSENTSFTDNSFSDTSFADTEDVAYAGEVEDKVNESTMLESEDNFDEGFNFVVGNESDEEEIPTISSDGPSLNINLDAFSRNSAPEEEEDVFVGDVEENVNQSNLIGNGDDDSEGFNFL